MNKLIKSLIGGGIVAGALGGGWMYAQSTAKDKLDTYLRANRLDRVLSYGEINYNPLSGKAEITDIKVFDDNVAKLLDGDLKIDKLTLLALETEPGADNTLHIKWEGLNINLLALARNTGVYRVSRLENTSPVPTLIALGYDRVTLNGEVDYHYSPDDETINLTAKFGIDQLGEITESVSVVNVREFLLRDLARLESQLDPENIFQTMQAFEEFGRENESNLRRIGIKSVALRYDDKGLMERIYAYGDVEQIRLPDDPSGYPEELVRKISKVEKEIQRADISDIPGGNKTREMLLDAVSRTTDFLEDPDFISLSWTPRRPIQLDQLNRLNRDKELLLQAEIKVDS
jgi:hypothetical protein